MICYIDENKVCHTDYKDGRTEADVSYFDDINPESVDCFKYDIGRGFLQCFDHERFIKLNPPPVAVIKYYAVDLLSSIGDVAGAERYDGIKAVLSANRIGGVPVWDMLISGMFIPATDPRLATIRNALVDAELVTSEEFDRILALAASDEPVAESGAAEG